MPGVFPSHTISVLAGAWLTSVNCTWGEAAASPQPSNALSEVAVRPQPILRAEVVGPPRRSLSGGAERPAPAVRHVAAIRRGIPYHYRSASGAGRRGLHRARCNGSRAGVTLSRTRAGRHVLRRRNVPIVVSVVIRHLLRADSAGRKADNEDRKSREIYRLHLFHFPSMSLKPSITGNLPTGYWRKPAQQRCCDRSTISILGQTGARA